MIVPVPPIIEEADPRVNKPPYVAPVEELFIIAPLLEIPVPLMVNASALVVPIDCPFKSKTAPVVSITPPAFVPKGPLVVTLEDAPNFNVPALMVVKPVNVLAPEIVQVPASCFVNVPDVVPKILVNVPPDAPPKVNPKVAPEIVPEFEILIVPVPPIIEDAEPSVIRPENVAPVDELLIIAPLEVIPVPFIVNGSAVL